MDDARKHRVKFFNRDHLSKKFMIDRVAELVREFSADSPPTSTVDTIEHYEAIQFFKEGIFPEGHDKQDISAANAKVLQIEEAVGRYFSGLSEENLISSIKEIDYEYHERLLELLGKYKVYNRCDADVIISALIAEGVHVREMVGDESLVKACDYSIRKILLSSSRNAELFVDHFLSEAQQSQIYLPKSLTSNDYHKMYTEYIDLKDANATYLQLIAGAKPKHAPGIDDKIRLKAKRRYDSEVSKIFEGNSGTRFGIEIIFDPDIPVPCKSDSYESNGRITRYAYSTSWLDKTYDYPSILNNFIHLFDFVSFQGLMVFPAYHSQRSTIESLFGKTGKNDYKTGVWFNHLDDLSLLQIHAYRGYLKSKGIEIESVISWFFTKYLPIEFGAYGFMFIPSDTRTSFLQRVRHLFPEMEGVAHQFSLYAEEHEIDPELLTMSSKQIRFHDIPTQLNKKYLFQSDDETVAAIIYQLYNDQSSITRTKDGRKASDAIELLSSQLVRYDDFHPWQQNCIDFLVTQGILANDQDHVYPTNESQVAILETLFQYSSLNYCYLTEAQRIEADKMVEKGWLKPRDYLLTEEEAAYFDYCLNARFSNGLNLRNRYSHATQGSEEEHYKVYLIVLRLLISLVIKINDDFCLLSPAPDSLSNGLTLH